jgi:predicted ester cyclase
MITWFTDGWKGNVDLADEIFAPDFSNNGIVVGPAGPKRNVLNRLAGFPDIEPVVEESITAGDMVVLRLRWTGTHTGDYLGVAATGIRVNVRDMTSWRFEDGRTVEDWTTGHIPFEIFGIELPAPIPRASPAPNVTSCESQSSTPMPSLREHARRHR